VNEFSHVISQQFRIARHISQELFRPVIDGDLIVLDVPIPEREFGGIDSQFEASLILAVFPFGVRSPLVVVFQFIYPCR
jgi:hypothetical protein